jgi:hypothetical protein
MFSSPLAADLKGFLTFKRSLGFAYKRAEFMLREFDRFLASGSRRHKARYSALDSAVPAWLADLPSPGLMFEPSERLLACVSCGSCPAVSGAQHVQLDSGQPKR